MLQAARRMGIARIAVMVQVIRHMATLHMVAMVPRIKLMGTQPMEITVSHINNTETPSIQMMDEATRHTEIILMEATALATRLMEIQLTEVAVILLALVLQILLTILLLASAIVTMDIALTRVRLPAFTPEQPTPLPQPLVVHSTLITTAYHLANAILDIWRVGEVASHTTKAAKTSMAITPTEIVALVIVLLVINGTRQELHACRFRPSYVLLEQHSRVRAVFAPLVLFTKTGNVFQIWQIANYLSAVTS